MFKKIKKIVGYLWNNEKSPFIESSISGVALKGLKGTFRKKVDQDDAWFFALAKHSDHVFDLGSNIGYMSLIAAIQKQNKSIILVDPNPLALGKAAQNMIINGFGDKSKFISAFIGDKDGQNVKFFTVGSGEAGSMYASHAETANALNSYYHVKKLTIDSIVENLNYIPDLVKIDVEGAEYLALRGACNVASKGMTKFIVEMHSLPELSMKENASLVLSWCAQNKYLAYYLKNAEVLTDLNIISERGKCHLLLLPLGYEYPEYLRNIKQRDELPLTVN